MLRKFGAHVRQQFVGYLALFIAVAGSAYAVAANSVGTAQLKNGAVTNPKLAANSVGTGKVYDNSLRGADINAATLGTVPSATNAGHAANADTLGGLASSDFLRSNAAAAGDLAGSYPSPTIRAAEAWHDLYIGAPAPCGGGWVGDYFCANGSGANYVDWQNRSN